MGIRGELWTEQIKVENRSYFFNVKENRVGDVFLQIVESKNKSGEEFDRHAIVVFESDMKSFFKGIDDSLKFIEATSKERKKQLRSDNEKNKKNIEKKRPISRKRKENSEKNSKKVIVHVASRRENHE